MVAKKVVYFISILSFIIGFLISNIFILDKYVGSYEFINKNIWNNNYDDTILKHPRNFDRNYNKYSSFICNGELTEDGLYNMDEPWKLCHFRNICYSTKLNNFVYYMDGDKTFHEILGTKTKRKHEIRDIKNSPKLFEKWILMHRLHYKEYISFNYSFSKVPSKHDDNVLFLKDKVYIYHHLQWLHNFGHCLTDNFWPMFRSMFYFDMYDPKICNMLLHHNKEGANLKETGYIGIKFIKQMNQYLCNGNEPLFIKFDKRESQTGLDKLKKSFKSIELDYPDKEIICFNDIIFSLDRLRMKNGFKTSTRVSKHYDWGLFIKNVFFNNELSHIQTYNAHLNMHQRYKLYGYYKQRVLILSKTKKERRHWSDDTNITDIKLYLSDQFDVIVDDISSTEIIKLSLTEQINLILTYDILITCAGAISFIGAFMREGTSMIEVDFWDATANKTRQMDSYIWAWDSRKKIYYYYVTPNDYIIDKNNKGNSMYRTLRNYANYKLKKNRISRYLHSALYWVEKYNDWNVKTFNKNPDIQYNPKID